MIGDGGSAAGAALRIFFAELERFRHHSGAIGNLRIYGAGRGRQSKRNPFEEDFCAPGTSPDIAISSGCLFEGACATCGRGLPAGARRPRGR